MLEMLLSHALTLVTVLLLFGLTIFIHELGHFWVARRCGLVVDAFAIGFGPALWKRKIDGVEWKICLLPFGGYVALPQMDPGSDHPDSDMAKRKLPRVDPWRRILVALAGVTGNMILAFLVAHLVYAGGKSFAPPEGEVKLGYVETNSAAYAAGLRMGDVVAQVNGKTVRSWEEFILVGALGDDPRLTVRSATLGEHDVTLPTAELMGTRYVEGVYPLNYCYVLNVSPGSSAAAAGLQSGDRILSLNGVELFSRDHLMDLVQEIGAREVELTYLREEATKSTLVTPALNEASGRYYIGIMFNQLDVKKPMEQIKSHAMLIVRLLKALVTPGESKAAAGAVGGPVAILSMFWLYVQSSFIMALWFTCLLNVNLAVLNLLPIPVLDGGHIVLSVWEWVTRRAVSYKVVSLVWNASAVVLLALFALLTWRDVQRFIGPRKAAAPPVEAVVSTNAPAVTE